MKLNRTAAFRVVLLFGGGGAILATIRPFEVAVLIILFVFLARVSYLLCTEKGNRSWMRFLKYQKIVRSYEVVRGGYIGLGATGVAMIDSYNYNVEINASKVGIYIRLYHLFSREVIIPWRTIRSIKLRRDKKNVEMWYAKIYMDEQGVIVEMIIPWRSRFEVYIPESVGFSKH